MIYVKIRLSKEKGAKKMKRLIMLILLMTALVACGQEENVEENEAPDVEKTEEAESKTNEENNAEDEKETNNETGNEGTEEKKEQDKSKDKEDNEEHKENNSKEKNNDSNKDKSEKKNSNNETDEKPAEKPSEKPEKEPTEKNEKVEVATENIIWAQNDRDYATLKGYLGQNITLDEKNNLLKITNVDYPHEAELLEGIKKENLEHRFTEEKGNDRIVGFAVTDYETELSYTIDFTMRVGKDSWKMLNMQINK